MPFPGEITLRLRCYRLYENLPARSPLGFGVAGGRWNHPGSPMIYASNIMTLPFLELYSIKGSAVVEAEWVLATLEIPDNLPQLDIENLPEDWNCRPPTDITKNFGTAWLKSGKSFCLKVPSARVPLRAFPEECNLLINPMHRDFGDLAKVVSVEEVGFAVG